MLQVFAKVAGVCEETSTHLFPNTPNVVFLPFQTWQCITASERIKKGKCFSFLFRRGFAKSSVPSTTQSCTACDAVAVAIERKGQPSTHPWAYVCWQQNHLLNKRKFYYHLNLFILFLILQGKNSYLPDAKMLLNSENIYQSYLIKLFVTRIYIQRMFHMKVGRDEAQPFKVPDKEQLPRNACVGLCSSSLGHLINICQATFQYHKQLFLLMN